MHPYLPNRLNLLVLLAAVVVASCSSSDQSADAEDSASTEVSADGVESDGDSDDGELDAEITDSEVEDAPQDVPSDMGAVDPNDPVILELLATIGALEARIDALETQVAGLPTASPTVAAHYHAEANQGFSPGAQRPRVSFEVQNFDTHNAVTTAGEWVFTAPVDGLYQVNVALALQGFGPTTGAHAGVYLHSSRVDYRLGAWSPVEPTLSITNFDMPVQGSGLVPLAAGETMWVEVDPPGFNLSLHHEDEQANYINIVRVGDLP